MRSINKKLLSEVQREQQTKKQVFGERRKDGTIGVMEDGTNIPIHWWLALHYQGTFIKIRMSLLSLWLSQFNKYLQTALHSVGWTPCLGYRWDTEMFPTSNNKVSSIFSISSYLLRKEFWEHSLRS